MAAFDQRFQGFAAAVARFDFDGDELVGGAHEKILFQRGISFFVVVELVAAFDERFADHIFVEGAFINTEVFVCAQIFLGFFVEHGDEESGVGNVDLEFVGIDISAEWELGKIQTVAEIDHAGVVEPFDAATIIAEARAGGDSGNLEFLVVARQLHGNVVEHVEDARLIHAFGVFADVFFVVDDELALDGEGAFKGAAFDVGAHDGWHAAEHTVIEKKSVKNGELQLAERALFLHVAENILHGVLAIAFCPEKLFEIEGAHFVVGFVADAVALDPAVVDAEHGAAANDIEATVQGEKFQTRGDLGKFLELVKNKECVVRQKFFGRIQEGDVFDDGVDAVAVCDDLFVVGFFDKVDGDDAFIVALAKVEDGCGFANLARPFDDEGLFVRCLSPMDEGVVDLSFEIHGTPSFCTPIIARCEGKIQRSCTKHERKSGASAQNMSENLAVLHKT